MMNHIIKFLMIAAAVVVAIPSYAVSQQEMEKARVMAAKHYLRYANNGSDYLDKLNPSSMAELSKELKAKEVENIKSFNAVSVPKDYASWDKAKLVEYWSNTFFKSPGLKEDGKKCLGILAKNLNKIEVKAGAAPAAAPAATPAATPAPEPAATQPAADNAANTADASQPTPAVDAAAEADAIAAEAEVAEENAIEEERPQKASGTIWYIAILVVLIGVVVWLVLYAQKSMRETGAAMAGGRDSEKEIREAKKNAKEEINKIREQYAASIAAKNEEIRQLRDKCESLQEELDNLRESNSRPAPAPAPTQARQHDNGQHDNGQRTTDNGQRATDNGQRATTTLPPVVYLGYVNQRGLFVKASRSLNVESSVYRMDIPDGRNGSFRVVNDPSIIDRLLADPALWLQGGCDIDNPGDADIATEVVTLTPGQALFADNTCRVVKKARIKFI